MNSIIEYIKKNLKVSFILEFTSSKLLAYLILFSGSLLSYYLKDNEPFTIAVIGSTALFGVKVLSNYTKK